MVWPLRRTSIPWSGELADGAWSAPEAIDDGSQDAQDNDGSLRYPVQHGRREGTDSARPGQERLAGTLFTADTSPDGC